MTSTAQKVIEILEQSSMEDAIKQDLIRSLKEYGANPTTMAFVRKAMEDRRDTILKDAGVDVANDEQYIHAVGEYLAKSLEADAAFLKEVTSLEHDAAQFKKNMQPDLDAIKAAHVKDQIEGN